MEKDSRARKVIEQLVRQEIEKTASETKDVVKEVVRATFLPQIRMAIWDSISEAMQEVLTEEISTVQKASDSEGAPETGTAFSETEADEMSATLRRLEEEMAVEAAKVSSNGSGRYVYCIADSGEMVNLGQIGVEDSEVYTIPYNGLCAVVHNCSAEPYKSEDEGAVKGWVQTHQKVLDVAIETFDTVLPLGFDTIVRSEDEVDPEQVVKDWLKDDFESLSEKIDRVRGKQEFGVQIFYDPKVMGEVIARENGEIQKLKEEMAAQKPGMAYMSKRKVEKAVKEEMEKRAQQHFKDFYGVIMNQVDDIKVEKVKRDKGKTMFMNLSCLVLKEKVEELGGELERIDSMKGFSVRFTGPWAPYSFV